MAIYEQRGRDQAFDAEEIRFFLALEHASDFKFEIDAVRALRRLGFKVHHAERYEDSVTNKLREFEIRASKCIGPENALDVVVGMAIECKNMSAGVGGLVRNLH